MEEKVNEENIENNLVFVSTLEKYLQANQYQDLFFEICHIRTKYVCFQFRLNFDFSFFIKLWRNRLCIWTISQERVDLDCNFWGSLPFKLTTVGCWEVWWPLQWWLCWYGAIVMATMIDWLCGFRHHFPSFQLYHRSKCTYTCFPRISFTGT